MSWTPSFSPQLGNPNTGMALGINSAFGDIASAVQTYQASVGTRHHADKVIADATQALSNPDKLQKLGISPKDAQGILEQLKPTTWERTDKDAEAEWEKKAMSALGNIELFNAYGGATTGMKLPNPFQDVNTFHATIQNGIEDKQRAALSAPGSAPPAGVSLSSNAQTSAAPPSSPAMPAAPQGPQGPVAAPPSQGAIKNPFDTYGPGAQTNAFSGLPAGQAGPPTPPNLQQAASTVQGQVQQTPSVFSGMASGLPQQQGVKAPVPLQVSQTAATPSTDATQAAAPAPSQGQSMADNFVLPHFKDIAQQYYQMFQNRLMKPQEYASNIADLKKQEASIIQDNEKIKQTQGFQLDMDKYNQGEETKRTQMTNGTHLAAAKISSEGGKGGNAINDDEKTQLAKMLLNGEISASQLGYKKAAVNARAKELDPKFDEVTNESDITSWQKNKTAMQPMNIVASNLNILRDVSDKLSRSNIPAGNNALQWVRKNLGDETATQYETAIKMIQDDLGGAVGAGTGPTQMTDKKLEFAIGTVSPGMSVKHLNAALGVIDEAMVYKNLELYRNSGKVGARNAQSDPYLPDQYKTSLLNNDINPVIKSSTKDSFGFTLGETRPANGKNYKYVGNNNWELVN